MRLEELTKNFKIVIFDSSALNLLIDFDSHNLVERLQTCQKRTEALRFVKNYVKEHEGVCISEMTFEKLKAGGYRHVPKKRRTDAKHFSLIKETPEERKSEYELKRQIKKESEARHSLADTFQTKDCVLHLTETEKFLYKYFSSKYEKLKFQYELDDVQYDFLTAGFTVSTERIEKGLTVLVSNNPKLKNFYISVIGSNSIVKPKNTWFYTRFGIDNFAAISM